MREDIKNNKKIIMECLKDVKEKLRELENNKTTEPQREYKG